MRTVVQGAFYLKNNNNNIYLLLFSFVLFLLYLAEGEVLSSLNMFYVNSPLYSKIELNDLYYRDFIASAFV